ncbi:hypothetical protein EI94DRAFT_1741512, partial [Lactarius quietus]
MLSPSLAFISLLGSSFGWLHDSRVNARHVPVSASARDHAPPDCGEGEGCYSERGAPENVAVSATWMAGAYVLGEEHFTRN